MPSRSPSPSPSPKGRPTSITLGVSSAEQVLADPHNRDTILRPKAGELPSAPTLCTAFILDVTRQSDGLSYSLPVRFSRFERLHRELSKELPPAVRAQLPLLPLKRVLAWDKLLGSPPSPEVIEERTHQLDRWVRALLKIDGVAETHALASLIFLGVGAETAIREAREAHDEECRTQTSRLDQVSAELAAVSAYAKACRARKDQADQRARDLSMALEASAQLLAHQRDVSRLARAWRDWSGKQQRLRAARERKQKEMLRTALDALTRRLGRAEARASEWGVAAAAMLPSLAQADETIADLTWQLRSERIALETTLRMHVDASHRAAAEAEEARQQVLTRAEAAELLAAERQQLLSTERASSATLVNDLGDADAGAAELADALADALAACVAHRDQLASERRARALAGVRHAAAQTASESRLLVLLQSQRERLAASALELAEARRQAAAAASRPEVEAPWLAPPPESSPGSSRDHEELAAAEQQAREELTAQWQREWLAALTHSL